MRDLLLVATILGLLPVAVFQPYVGILLWCWIDYMSPHRLTWGFAYNFPFAQWTGLATIAGLFVTSEKMRFPWSVASASWMMFALWPAVTTQFAMNTSPAEKQFDQFLKIQIMTLIMILVMNSREKLRAMIWVIVGSFGFFGVKGGIFALATRGQYRVWGPPESMVEGNNELAFALVVSLPLMRYLQATTERRIVKHVLTVMMVLCAISVAASYSRGALLAAASISLGLVLQSRKKVIIGTLVCLVFILILAFAPSAWFERMQTIKTYEQDASAMGRINAWTFAVNLAMDRPIVGGGFDAFTKSAFLVYAPNPLDFHDSHSIYFGVLGEHGFVGLSLFLSMLTTSLLEARRVRRSAEAEGDMELRELASMIQTSLLGYMVGGAFLGLGYFGLLYNVVAVILILRGLPKRPRVSVRIGEREAAGGVVGG